MVLEKYPDVSGLLAKSRRMFYFAMDLGDRRRRLASRKPVSVESRNRNEEFIENPRRIREGGSISRNGPLNEQFRPVLCIGREGRPKIVEIYEQGSRANSVKVILKAFDYAAFTPEFPRSRYQFDERALSVLRLVVGKSRYCMSRFRVSSRSAIPRYQVRG